MGIQRFLLALLAAALLLGGALAPVPNTRSAGAAQAEACFAETNRCIRGRFLDYWTINGGLARNGYPLSEERVELLEDGNEYVVQYFERVRLEYHPENDPPYDVLIGQFGRWLLDIDVSGRFTEPRRAAAPIAGQAYFPETGHNVGGRFLEYWQANGGLAQFGYPLTEEFRGVEVAIPGDASRVQYFERARLEYHPAYAGTPYEILLGHFGRQVLAQSDLLAGGFRHLYVTDEAVRARLGAPRAQEGPIPGGQVQVPGATQAFERGRMVYLERDMTLDLAGDYVFGPTIHVLAGSPSAGEWRRYRDTWEEGQEPGGGPAPTPGLYYPQRGFGKVWREGSGVREAVGYALTGDEQALTLTVQYFDRGQMLAVATPEGRFIYVLSFTIDRGGRNFEGRYERYQDRSR